MSSPICLLPAPRRVTPGRGALPLDPAGAIPRAAGPEVVVGAPGVAGEEAYRLAVTGDRVVVEAGGAAGAFYARATLDQLARTCGPSGAIPAMTIEDAPDFPERGAMLDVSRDKVPTMETLFRTIDLLASLKYNRLQLYVEHTFAYRAHRTVWAGASPLTGEEIEALDAYCKERHVELVPNQNSFGHFERWLKHPAYAPLAESDDPAVEYRSLCPIDPRSIALLAGLYDELLPHFASRTFNVGCDETLDLGKGRSAAAVAREGVGRVYLGFLEKIHRLVRARGRTMQFWGDIVLEHPELIPELPRDLVALNWGYEADHPFELEGARFAEAGIAYQVCPGTSSWLSLAGRTANALANLESAARHGAAHGATGMLVTDWGDHGHWQPWPISFVGWAQGAAMAWGREAAAGIDLARAIDLHVARDASGTIGRLLLDLGDVHRETGVTPKNASVLALLLLFPERPMGEGRFAGLTVTSLDRALASAERILAALPRVDLRRDDAELLAREVALAGDLVRAGCRLGRARLGAAEPALADDLDGIVERYRAIWRERNRPGGLSESEGRLARAASAARG